MGEHPSLGVWRQPIGWGEGRGDKMQTDTGLWEEGDIPDQEWLSCAFRDVWWQRGMAGGWQVAQRPCIEAWESWRAGVVSKAC